MLPSPNLTAAPGLRFDVEAAAEFLRALGADASAVHYRAIHWDHTLQPAGDRAAHLPPTFSPRAARLEQLQQQGYRLYWLPNGGPNDGDVLACPYLFVEWDDRDLAWQTTAWRELGLPEPTALLSTGGKSIHCYWRLAAPIAPDRWRDLTSRLIHYCDSDRSCKNPSRLMRLAGSSYIYKAKDLDATGASLGGQLGPHRARLISSNPAALYPAELFEERLPQLPPPPAPPPAPAPAAPSRTSAPTDPRSYAELERLVSSYPTIVANNGQRDEALRLVCGLARCMELIGRGKADAIALASSYHPQARDTFEGVERWAFEQFDAGSFVKMCKAAGVDVSRHDIARSSRSSNRSTGPAEWSPYSPPDPAGPHAATSTPAAAAPCDPDDDDAAATLAAELDSFRDLSAAAELATIARVFPPGLANTITQYATEQQLQPRGFILPILTTAASILGNRVEIAAEPGNNWTEPAIIWGINVTGASEGKSPTAKPCTITALAPWQLRLRERHADELTRWKQDRAAAERAAKAALAEAGNTSTDPLAEFLADNPQPEQRHLLISDATFEKVEDLLARGPTPGLLSYHDELTSWFQQHTRSPHRSDRAKWLALYPGAPLITDRMGRESIFVPRPAVSLFGNLQPDVFQGLWKADTEANLGAPDADGLWSRFLWFDLGEWSYTYRSSTTHLAPVLGNLYRAIDAAAAQLPPPSADDDRPPVLALDPDALPLFIAWIDQLEELKRSASDPADRQYLGKQRGVTLRLALVVHAIRQASAGLGLALPISSETLQTAILLTALFATEREKLLAPVRGSSTGAIKRLLDKGRQWRQQHGARPVPQRQIRSWCLPARGCPAAEVRNWLTTVIAQTPGCGTVRPAGKSLEWIPPGD